MKYLFEQPRLTCVSIENTMNLPRGTIKEITLFPEGAAEIDTTQDLTPAQLSTLKTLLLGYNLPHGWKAP